MVYVLFDILNIELQLASDHAREQKIPLHGALHGALHGHLNTSTPQPYVRIILYTRFLMA